MEGHWLNCIADTAKQHGHHKATGIYREDGSTDWLSYGQLYQRALAGAQRLRTAGLEPGDRALLLCSTSVDFVLSFFSCMFSGVIAVPLYPPRSNRKAGRIVSVNADCTPRAVIAPFEGGNAAISRMLDEIGINALQIDSRELIGPGSDTLTIGQWPSPDKVAFLQYTSGSTGTPKGVMVTHRCLSANLDALARRNEVDETSRVLSWLPLHHDMGLIGGFLTPLQQGASTLLIPPVSFFNRPALWPELMTSSRATHSVGPNFAFELCVERVTDEQVAHYDLSQCKNLTSGAEPIQYETLNRFKRKFANAGLGPEVIKPSYGMAEATLGVTAEFVSDSTRTIPVPISQLDRNKTEASADEPFKPVVSCGPPLDNVTVRIADPETLTPLEDGEVGEILVQAPSVALGYWGRADATEETFWATLPGHTGTFLRTGDLGFMNEGELFVTGRLKDVIIVGGRNIYPQDIEQTVQQAWRGFNVGHGAAFTIEDEGQDNRLVVVQEVQRVYRNHIDAELDAEKLLREIREIHELDCYELVLTKPNSVPMTSSGKIQRRATRQSYLDGTLSVLQRFSGEALAGTYGTDAAGEPVEDRDEIATIVLATVAHGIGCAPDDLNESDELTQFGFDSMHAAHLAQTLTRRLGRTVEAVWFLDAPTLGVLADRIANDGVMSDETETAETAEQEQPTADDDPLALIEELTDEQARAVFDRA